MENIATTVTALWEFLVPPIIKVALAVGLVAWIAKPILDKFMQYVATTAGKFTDISKTYPSIKSLGLEKLIPAIAVFIFVFAIYSSNKIMLEIGWRLPISVTTFQPVSLLHHTTEDRLLSLWKLHPEMEFSDLSFALENDLLKLSVSHTSDVLSNVKSWELRSKKTVRWFYTVKFLIAFNLFLCFVAVWKSWEKSKAIRRSFISIVLLLGALTFLTSRQLYNYNQLLQAKYGLLAATLESGNLDPDILDNLQSKIRITEKMYGDDPWWELRFLDTKSWLQGIKYLDGNSIYHERNAVEEVKEQSP